MEVNGTLLHTLIYPHVPSCTHNKNQTTFSDGSRIFIA
jgi:hypothetical protein